MYASAKGLKTDALSSCSFILHHLDTGDGPKEEGTIWEEPGSLSHWVEESRPLPRITTLDFWGGGLGDPHPQHLEIPRLGVESELQLLAYRIQVPSVIYTRTHGNIRSLTH